jgi:hypothetical protein
MNYERCVCINFALLAKNYELFLYLCNMKRIKTGFLYYVFATLLLAVIFGSYIIGDSLVPSMDFMGWLFFLTSCLAHAALLVLVLFLVFYLPWALLRLQRLAAVLFVSTTSLLSMVSFVNMQVYKIYRFHINGFIMNLLTGPGAGDIFDFDTKLYLTEGVMLVGILLLCIALWFLARRMAGSCRKAYLIGSTMLLIGSLLVANGLYVYGSFVMRPAIVKSARLVPYYFPLSATGLLRDLGFERKVLEIDGDLAGDGDLNYPLHELRVDTSLSKRPNVVFILIDSWSRRALTEECMPNLWKLAHEEQWYDNHVSCSNGTRYAVFGLFTGVQPYYYSVFEASRTSPVFIDCLMGQDYDFRAYPSATLRAPDFRRILFHRLSDLRTDTEGDTAFERDLRIKDDLIADLPKLKNSEKPFFAFIFFDLLHAYSLPKELLNRFQPSWEYGNFSVLNNDMDPTPFWNLYRNSAYQTDKMVGELIDAMKAAGLYDNTLVYITGDHAQEYNENHKNYWGHNSNFSTYQIGVPLIVHEPGDSVPQHFTHRTTHYDFVPTMLHDYLGVQNPIEDYTAGRLLSDTTLRLWHFVGNELRYAFLVEGDTILTKEGAGYVEVTDAKLNPVENYHIKPKAFNEAMEQLNRFFK